MVLTVTLNPCVDYLLRVDKFLPNDTNRVLVSEKDAGGKGLNTSRVYAHLGGETIATGFLGGATAAFIRHVMEEEGVEDGFVQIAGETRTNFSVEDNSDDPPTTFNQKGPTISDDEWKALVESVEILATKATWVSFGGSLPPGLSTDAFYQLALIAKKAGAKVVIDADGAVLAEGLKADPDFIKPNSKEAGRLLGRPIESDEDVIAAAKELYAKIGGGHRYVVISRGEKGAVMACQEGTFLGKSPKVHPKSTIGSGDSMIAGMLWALVEGKSAEEALRWGLAAGAATALTDGTAIGGKATTEQLFPEALATQI
ncbi:MAG: 1-phosphofructokinase [Armatimonadetes bacterium]|nr:1-phosphofructokinase [Armatimonadota bacterium]